MMPLFTMHHDAREIGPRENRRWRVQRGKEARQAQRHRDERDGNRVTRGKPAQAGGFFGTHCADPELVDELCSAGELITWILVFSGSP